MTRTSVSRTMANARGKRGTPKTLILGHRRFFPASWHRGGPGGAVTGRERSTGVVILLTILTLGIYWIVRLFRPRRQPVPISPLDAAPASSLTTTLPETVPDTAAESALEAEIERDLAQTQYAERPQAGTSSSGDLVVQKATGITDTPAPAVEEPEEAPKAKEPKRRKPVEESVEVVVPKKWTNAPAPTAKPATPPAEKRTAAAPKKRSARTK